MSIEQDKARLILYIHAWLIADLAVVTQEILDKEIAEILSGEVEQDCQDVVDQWRGQGL